MITINGDTLSTSIYNRKPKTVRYRKLILGKPLVGDVGFNLTKVTSIFIILSGLYLGNRKV